MAEYVVMGRPAKSNDGWDDPPVVRELSVFEPDTRYSDTGLVDLNGGRLYRMAEERPIGYHAIAKSRAGM